MIRSILFINSILETNYISKIESQLKNRCIKRDFRPLGERQFFEKTAVWSDAKQIKCIRDQEER